MPAACQKYLSKIDGSTLRFLLIKRCEGHHRTAFIQILPVHALIVTVSHLAWTLFSLRLHILLGKNGAIYSFVFRTANTLHSSKSAPQCPNPQIWHSQQPTHQIYDCVKLLSPIMPETGNERDT